MYGRLLGLSILLAGGCDGPRARVAHTPVSAPSKSVCAAPVAMGPIATFLSDWPATPQEVPNGIVLHKTLSAFPSFGGYDVAYTGQTAVWTFAIPAMKVKSARLVLLMNADDHATNIGDYRYSLVSGACAHDNPVPLSHGKPANSSFDNWIEVTVPAEVVPGQTFNVSLTNLAAGAAGPLDWIAVRWVEVRIEAVAQ